MLFAQLFGNKSCRQFRRDRLVWLDDNFHIIVIRVVFYLTGSKENAFLDRNQSGSVLESITSIDLLMGHYYGREVKNSQVAISIFHSLFIHFLPPP
jgi:hypothetical protein